MKKIIFLFFALFLVLACDADDMEQILQEQRRVSADYSTSINRLASDYREGHLSQAEYAAKVQEVAMSFAATNASIRARAQEAASSRQRNWQESVAKRQTEVLERFQRSDKSEQPDAGTTVFQISEQELETAIRERRILDIGRWIDERKTTAEEVKRIQQRIDSEKSEDELKSAIREDRLSDIAQWIQQKETTVDAVANAKAAVEAEKRRSTSSESRNQVTPDRSSGGSTGSDSTNLTQIPDSEIKAALRNADEDLIRKWIHEKRVSSGKVTIIRDQVRREERLEKEAKELEEKKDLERRRKELFDRYDAELRSDFKEMVSVSDLTLEEVLASGNMPTPGVGYWGGLHECLVEVDGFGKINRTFNQRFFSLDDRYFNALTKTHRAVFKTRSDHFDGFSTTIEKAFLVCPIIPLHGGYLRGGLFVYDGLVRPPEDPVDVTMDIEPEHLGIHPIGGLSVTTRTSEPIPEIGGRFFGSRSRPWPDMMQFHEVSVGPKTPSIISTNNHAAGDTKTIALPGGETIELIWCPPGTFRMGNPRSISRKTGYDRFHKVSISKGFWLAKSELTRGQWEAVMGKKESQLADQQMLRGSTGFDSFLRSLKNDDPRTGISWNDCQRFFTKLNAMTPKVHVRFPTAAEWEYACRSGDSDGDAPGNLDEIAWHDEPPQVYSRNDWIPLHFHAVGMKSPNAWGFFDMLGNVAEWCQDWFGEFAAIPETDPTGPSFGVTKAVRGGTLFGPAPQMVFFGTRGSVSYFSREQNGPREHDASIGVRIAADDADYSD